MRTGSTIVLLLSFLGLACGRTSEDDAARAAHPPGSGGSGPGAGAQTAAGRAGTAGGGFAGDGTELSYVDLTGTPIYTRVQRLSNRQWENAVGDILRLQQPHALSAAFTAPVSGSTTFDNNEQVLFVDQPRFIDFETGAEAAAAMATGSPEALAALYTGSDAAGFVRVFGRRAFRRPLTGDEETKYQNMFALGERLYGAGFANGAALVIRAMLESPQFLYRTELGPAGDRLSPYELASKLSFWLLGTTPSDELLDAAAAGKFANDDELETAAREMLEDPRALSVMRDFHGQLLRVPLFRSIEKPGVTEFDRAINAELTLASNAFFDFVFEQNLGLRELLTSKQAYVGRGLGPFYGVGAPSSGLALFDLGPSRTGYFMQVPFLMLWGVGAEPSSIERGIQLEATLLCGPQRSPQAAIPPVPPIKPGQTNRQRITELDSSCGGLCHRYIDPLGFAFENFDGLGRKRESDNGFPVDTTGSYPLAEGVASFADGTELMKLLADSTQVHTCYSKHVTSYALGRDLTESDRSVLESLAKVSRAHSLKELVVALVRDPAFRTRKDGQP
ncbi:MAG TPA: DUF1592 domain-containing protein [Polyangiaceae bacterium]|nr:DUF1592 domain-containing protein [Polyangiaceae bacterium]